MFRKRKGRRMSGEVRGERQREEMRAGEERGG